LVDSGELMRYGAAVGFSSIGLDVGCLPYAERVAKVSRAARWLSANYVFVEAGLGPVQDWLQSAPNGHASNATALAADFVARTKIDALNVTLINTAERTFGVAPDVSVIHRLREHVRVPLVLQLDSPMTNRDLQRSVRAGIVKVNVRSTLDITFSSALRHRLGSDTTGDPRSYLAEVRTALTETVSVIIGTITGDDPSHTP
jgi:fructose-bisphosphate aldolase class II